MADRRFAFALAIGISDPEGHHLVHVRREHSLAAVVEDEGRH